MENIKDINIYNERMEKSVIDKLFFLNYIYEPIEYIVDFGCANGMLIKAIKALFGDTYKYIGYDSNPEMIELAKANCPDVYFTSDWNEIKIPFENSILVLSSVLHEIYSYDDPDKVWDMILKKSFKYIAIRDMFYNPDCSFPGITINSARNKILKTEYADMLDKFENIWGVIKTPTDLSHFLLKYMYKENQNREIAENYFALTKKEIYNHLLPKYKTIMSEEFVVPYVKTKVLKDFGINMNSPTHIKAIYKLNITTNKTGN